MTSAGISDFFSLYIHIPFCKHRCAYCDFNTYAGQEDSIPAYVDVLCAEIAYVGGRAASGITAHTVFFGGGTPSLLSPSQFERILQTIHLSFDLTEDAEITIEANPGTVSKDGLRELRGLGINRISFGAQSANGEELRMLERRHGFLDVIRSVEWSRLAGFNNLNLDLIYGLPEQDLETWRTTVRRILDLHPEHISMYALTVEHGTPFGRWMKRGLLPVPDPDAAAEMYEWASNALCEAGYLQYEISNWATESAINAGQVAQSRKDDNRTVGATGIKSSDFACRHNLQYWRCLPYLGFGAGAHGYAAGYRYSNVLRIKTYVERMRNAEKSAARGSSVPFPLSPAVVNQHEQSTPDDMSDFMITGLRLTREGVDPAAFKSRFDRDIMEVYGAEIADLEQLGLLESHENSTSDGGSSSEVLRLTERGRLLGNQVFMRFV